MQQMRNDSHLVLSVLDNSMHTRALSRAVTAVRECATKHVYSNRVCDIMQHMRNDSYLVPNVLDNPPHTRALSRAVTAVRECVT